MSYYVNPDIESLNRIFDQNKREGYLRLDLNENPGGLDEAFLHNVLSGVNSQLVAQYPETLEFTEALAQFLGTDIEHLCLVNGSSEGIRYIIEAFTSPGGKVVGVTPTYAMFEVYCAMYGRSFVSVGYDDDLRMPINKIIEAVDHSTQLLILLNPNNPVGNVYTDEEMAELLEAARANEATVLVDEAYHYFYPESFIRYALECEHVFVTRTFSKLFSMAGCRLGYVVGWPEGVKMVQKLCTPHNVNAFALRFARAIFEDEDVLLDLIRRQREGKKYLVEGLERAGYRYHAGEGNFIFVKPKSDAGRVVGLMKSDKGILVKTYAGIGSLGECLRVTTGERCYMEQFLNALQEIDARLTTGKNSSCIELVQLSQGDSSDVYDMLQHIGPNENEFTNDAYGVSYSEFRKWLIKLDGWSRSEGLPDGYVRQWVYWLMLDGVPVGFGKLRAQLTQESRRKGGNVGYAIDNRYRGRGLGLELMTRLIAKAKELGIEERILTVEKNNLASKAIVEKCGARLVDENEDRWVFSL